MEKIKKELTSYFYTYVNIILEEYSMYIDKNIIKKYKNIKDYSKYIQFDSNIICPKIYNECIYLPTKIFCKHKKTFKKENKIIDNYYTYLKYLYKNVDKIDYYKYLIEREIWDLFCSRNILKDNLIKIRMIEINNKYNLGNTYYYSKGMELVSYLDGIYGKELVNKIIFENNEVNIINMLKKENIEYTYLYKNISENMNIEYKYYKINTISKLFLYNIKYNNIKYKKAYKIINKYMEISKDN